MVQNGRMRQRLDAGHAYECREFHIGNTNHFSTVLEVGLEQGINLPVEGFHLLEPAHTRNLLRQHAV